MAITETGGFVITDQGEVAGGPTGGLYQGKYAVGSTIPNYSASTSNTSSPAVITSGAAKQSTADSLAKLNAYNSPTNPTSQDTTRYTFNGGVNAYGETYAQVFGGEAGANNAGGGTGNAGTGTGDGKTGANNQQSTDSTASLIPGTDQVSTGDPDTDAAIQSHSDKAAQFESDAAGYRQQLADIQSGKYVNPQTVTLIDSITKSFDAQIAAQTQVNKQTLAGYTQAGIRSGRNMYAPEIEMGNLKAVMDQGIAKITDITYKKESAIAKAQIAATANDFKELSLMMADAEKQSASEIKATLDLYKEVRNNEKDALAKSKADLANLKTQDSLTTQQAKDHAYTVLSYLDSKTGTKGESTLQDDIAAVQEYAAANGLDPDKLLAQVEQLKSTKDKYGSGAMGQYQFALDHGQFKGTFEEYQTKTATDKATSVANATLAAKQKLKQTPTYKEKIENSPPSSNNKTSPGKKTANSKGKVFEFSPKQLTQLQSRGIDSGDAKGVLKDIQAGHTLEDIRQNMKRNGIDPRVLDNIMYFVDPKNNTPS